MRCHRVACLLVLFWPPATVADERVRASYELFWSGLEIGAFETALATGDDGYRLTYTARTTGFLGWLFPFTSRGTSEGLLADPGPVPLNFMGESERGDGRSRWMVEFAPSGQAQKVEVSTPEDEERDPVPPALRRAPDPLALALFATDAMAPGRRIEATGFDGKRAVRFDLACDTSERVADLNVGAGRLERALFCTLDGGVEAGRSRRWGDGRDDEREPARVVLSREIVPGRYWPVRIEADTRWGIVIAHLAEIRS